MDTSNTAKSASESTVEQGSEPPDLPQAPLAAKLLIVTFTLGYIAFALYMVVDCWVLEQGTLKQFLGLSNDKTLPPLFISAVHAVLGAVLGAGALDIVSFHRYVSVERNFQSSHVWGYFIGPWLAAVLGLVVFALLQSGLLVFTGGGSTGQGSSVSNLGYLAVGFLSGFGWYQATMRIREIVSRFFAPDENKPTRREETTDVNAATVVQTEQQPPISDTKN